MGRTTCPTWVNSVSSGISPEGNSTRGMSKNERPTVADQRRIYKGTYNPARNKEEIRGANNRSGARYFPRGKLSRGRSPTGARSVGRTLTGRDMGAGVRAGAGAGGPYRGAGAMGRVKRQKTRAKRRKHNPPTKKKFDSPIRLMCVKRYRTQMLLTSGTDCHGAT